MTNDDDLSRGDRERLADPSVDAELPPADDASDPHVSSTGQPTQREEDVPLPFAPLKWPA
jgi:hypothetical protein